MHSFQHGNTVIHHNGDYSGDAKITTIDPDDDSKWTEFTIPCDALVAFARDATINEVIATLEEKFQ